MTPERQARLESIQGYVMLVRKPNDPEWYGPVEKSFSLDTAKRMTFFYWSSLPDSGYKPPVDGLEWLRRDLSSWKTSHPDWTYFIYDARQADVLPVVLDWKTWLWAHEPRADTLSGITDKFRARNFSFTVKPETREARVQSTFTF